MNCLRMTSAALVLCLAASPAAAVEDSGQQRPKSPRDGVIRLFNGRDLSGFATWLKDSKLNDPRRVFTAADGMIRISGEGRGYLATKEAYENYHLCAEYKWGQRTDGSKYVRNSGILLHAVGPHGGASGVWMTSIECQLAQGCEGDLILIRGKDERGDAIDASITSETALGPDNRPRWKRGAAKTVYSGRQFWWSDHDPQFQELLDTRGRWDVASPLGQWTRVECICAGDRVTIKINGVTVNECFDVRPSSGKILLQNEGNEIFFRNVELRPLPRGNSESQRSKRG